MITIRDGVKTYHSGAGTVQALRGVSLDIPRRDFVAIMGPSGSGKSTLLNVLGCLDMLDTGRYLLDDEDLVAADTRTLAQVRNRKFGFVFQMFNLIPRLTALRNVELPMIYGQVPASERRSRARRALEQVGLADRCNHSPAQLSGGQQQRVAIARAIVNEPEIIIADEPTGSLDSRSSEDIMALFHDLHAQEKTIIMVTHENDVAAHAQRLIRLRDGQLLEDSAL